MSSQPHRRRCRTSLPSKRQSAKVCKSLEHPASNRTICTARARLQQLLQPKIQDRIFARILRRRVRWKCANCSFCGPYLARSTRLHKSQLRALRRIRTHIFRRLVFQYFRHKRASKKSAYNFLFQMRLRRNIFGFPAPMQANFQ